MSWLDRIFRARQINSDLSAELRSHLDEKIDSLVASGIPRREAELAARRQLGNATLLEEQGREVWRWPRLENLISDVRFALRMLRLSPVFTCIAVLTLALAIGANTAIFSVVNGVVLAPLPYAQPDRLVLTFLNNLNLGYKTSTSYPDFLDWKRSSLSFESMAAFSRQNYDLSSPGSAAHVLGEGISSGFFRTLGVSPALGREFTPEEDRPGGPPAAILSNSIWRDRFGASPAALGRSITLDGSDFTVVGVLPPAFRFWNGAEIYTPIGQADSKIVENRAAHAVLGVARLKSRVNIGEAQAELDAIQQNINRMYPNVDRGLQTSVISLKEVLVGDVSSTLMLLLGAVGLVLLIACANVASLLLARSVSRTREFAVRASLGAGRERIVRQLLTESLLLSLIGGAAGILLAGACVAFSRGAVASLLPVLADVRISLRVLAFTFAISTAVGILFGFAPALKSWKPDPQALLKEGARGSSGAQHRAQSSLVVAQIALTLVLLVGAGLLFRTMRSLWGIDPGFDVQHTITFKVDLAASESKTPAAMRAAYQATMARIRQVAGVESAEYTMLVPLGGDDNSVPFWVGPSKLTSAAEAPRMLMFVTGPDYLKTMGIPLLQGRFISPDETTKTPMVVDIDSVFAQKFFPDVDPVGKTITFEPNRTVRIVGVVGHVKHRGLGVQGAGPQNQVYFAFYQVPDDWLPAMHSDTSVILRTSLPGSTVMTGIRDAVQSTGSERPVYAVESMHDVLADSMSSQRMPMALLGAFAALALALASVGIYGVISYSVTRRAHEIGIRMALGAKQESIFRLIIGDGVRLALAGLGIGVPAALILTKLLTSFSRLLYGVHPGDPETFAAVSGLLAIVALLACYFPARHAMRVDPIVALRQE
jgi:predicted permease